MKTKITDPRSAPNTGSYSPALRVGEWIFVSGQGPIDPEGSVVTGDVASEVRLTLQNICNLVEAAGASMDHVVKCTCYLADMEDFDAFDAAYRQFFGDPPPTRTTVEVGLQGIKIEIDAMAYVGK